MYATISSDIVASTSLSALETIELKQKTEKLLEQLQDRYPDLWGRQIKGDYIECVMTNVKNAFRVALIIKSYVKSFAVADKNHTKDFQTYGLRMAIGIGEMRIVDVEHGILDGEAIYLSGRAIEEMGIANKGTMTIKSNLQHLASPLRTVALLTDALMNNMTARQSEIIYYKLLGYKETDIATQVGIKQSSVNRAATASKWYCIEEALEYFEQINFEEYE